MKLSVPILAIFLTSCSYLPEPIPRESNIKTDETPDYIKISPSFDNATNKGIIFYPGGLVDPHAYIPTFDELIVKDSIDLFILKSPANLSILNSGYSKEIINSFPEYERWYIGGHSLGGSVACMDIEANPESFEGAFLLASYSVNDISNSEVPILSLTGSEDLVIDQNNFNENKKNLPTEVTISDSSLFPNFSTIDSTIYFEIPGGNHAQFGGYGFQKGDGTALISLEEQHSFVTALLSKFLKNN